MVQDTPNPEGKKTSYRWFVLAIPPLLQIPIGVITRLADGNLAVLGVGIVLCWAWGTSLCDRFVASFWAKILLSCIELGSILLTAVVTAGLMDLLMRAV